MSEKGLLVTQGLLAEPFRLCMLPKPVALEKTGEAARFSLVRVCQTHDAKPRKCLEECHKPVQGPVPVPEEESAVVLQTSANTAKDSRQCS